MIKSFFTNKILLLTLIQILFSCFLYGQLNDGSRYAKNSVLSKGNWYKIQVESTGVYKLTYEDLKKIGISKPQNVQIYGYGGAMLPEDFTTPYIDDLPQVSVWMNKKASDFGPGDFLLFYGVGNISWSYDQKMAEFVHSKNPYSSDSYYFITESEDGPLIMEEISSDLTGGSIVNDFSDYFLHEKDIKNISETGREFYGEDFRSSPSLTINLPLLGITKDPAIVRFDFITRVLDTSPAGVLTLSLNGTTSKKFELPRVDSRFGEYVRAKAKNDTVRVNLPESNLLKLNYQLGSSGDKNVHLNYIRVNYKRKLKSYGAVTLFRSSLQKPNIEYRISDASTNLLVFDVTDNVAKKVKPQSLATELSFSASNSSIREYALIDVAKPITTPRFIGKIANQDLHASEPTEMIIIVQPYLQKYAEALAKIHADDSGLKTLIVNPDKIYNEFSSGSPDVTAYRRFVKMFYDRAESDVDKPKYLLLFGDGSFDNRFLQNDWSVEDKKSMLLTFQSENSLDEELSYVTDDYMGFLDDNEGINLGSDVLDIGIGRLPVRSEKEASDVLAKLTRYIQNKDQDIWKNNLCFVADDAIADKRSVASEREHMLNTKEFTEFIEKKYPDFIVNKIYADANERVVTTKGARYPDVTKAIIDKLNSGVLVLNFVGHGSTRVWTHEEILTYSDVESLTNSRLPLWITATCDYSRFDAIATSGGELALLNPKGGAIALFSTVRVVYSSNNRDLSNKLFDNLFLKDNNQPMRLGDVIRKAKVDLQNETNKLKFMLLGDPALRLSYPGDEFRVKVTEMNGKAVDDSPINIAALSDTNIKGIIVDKDGNVAEDFSGLLESIVFDSEQDMQTRGNTVSGGQDPSIVMKYRDFINTIFSGNTKIENGRFDITFVTPKDILYSNNYGKMSFYAKDPATGMDAQGSFLNYKVGGTDSGAVEENNPPVISTLFLNSDNFQSGDEVNSTPLFHAEVSDDTGINLSNAIGHNISLTINDRISYNLTPYFVSSNESTKSGKIRFSIPELPNGKHTLKFKVWDVWNNSTTESRDFIVSDNFRPSIYDFQIIGNPARKNTLFLFTSNIPGSAMNVRYEVFSYNGAKLWAHEEKGASDLMSYYEYEWDLTTSNGMRVGPGVYICRVSIDINGRYHSSKSQKLIILAQ